MGPVVLENARVDVLPEDAQFGKEPDGILSLHCLRKTIVVLDFQKNLLWVRTP
jgi:hypothetical protein